MTSPEGLVPLVIQPLQWSSLPELHDVNPLDASDHACMTELAAVLAKHGKLNRFALHLAHRHFDLDGGEVLIERSDHDARTQRIEVGRLDQIADAVPTTWLLNTAPDMLAAEAIYCVCVADTVKTTACSRHGKSSSPGEAALHQEAVLNRRIAEDKAKYERGFPVAGHDPRDRER